MLGGGRLRGDRRRGPRAQLIALLGAAVLGCGPASKDAGSKPQACGRVVFMASMGEEDHGGGRMQVVAASGGPASAVTSTNTSAHELSEYPAAISPDGHTLLVLTSRPDAEGKTLDRFGLVELGALPSEVRLIGPQAQLRNPSWSPDGRWIVYESDASSFRDLYRLELGARGAVHRATSLGLFDDGFVAESSQYPDTASFRLRALAENPGARSRAGLHHGLLATDVELRLTNDPQGNFEPTVAPDGQRIAFVSSRDGNAEIYAMTADGGAPTRLTNSPGDDTAPVWSPDGTTIAFTSARERERGIDVYLMDPDGGEQRPALRERENSVIAQDLVFSPTGKQLAFTELRPTRGGAIVIVDIDTGALVARSEGGSVDEQPSWSGDALFVAFSRRRGEGADIAWMRADGSETRVLTDGQGVYWLPRWVSDGQCPRVTAPVLPAPAGQG